MDKKSMLRSAGGVSIITFGSRIFGYIRDMLLAYWTGTGLGGDAFIVAFRIPNLLRRLMAEGSMTASFVPVFTEYLKTRSRRDIWDFAGRFFYTLSVILVVITLLGIIFSPCIMKLLASRFAQTPGKMELTVFLNRIMFPYILLISLSAVMMAILNSLKSFAVPAFSPIILNLVIIFTAYILAPRMEHPSICFAIGVILGGILQLLYQVPFVVRRGMSFRPRISFSHPGIKKVLKLMGPGVLGIGATQINILISTAIAASLLRPGTAISIYYADRIMELTLGVFAISISTVILPVMSAQAVARQYEALKETMAFALRVVSFITIPAAIGLIILRVPVVNVLFERGRFDGFSTAMTAYALGFYAVGLIAFAWVKVVVPAYYSQQDTRTPVKIAVVAVAVNIGLNFLLLHRLKYGGSIALAGSLAAFCHVSMLLFWFRKRRGQIGMKQVAFSTLRILFGAAVMGFYCYQAIRFCGYDPGNLPLWQGMPLWQRISSLVFVILSGIGVYLGVAYVLRCPEIKEILMIFRRKTIEEPS